MNLFRLPFFLLLPLLFTSNHAVTFEITNRCNYTVWAAATPVGGGQQLDKGQTWTINITTVTGGRIWPRTGCIFDASGRGSCLTGDCGGLLQCTGGGRPPCTISEFTLSGSNNRDFFDISLVDGFNVPTDFSPTSGGCTRGVRCNADIKGQCPNELRAPGGCHGPCTVFNTARYCCMGNFSTPSSCGPTNYSKFFKDRCPDAYSYPYDDKTSTFTCPSGANYRVVFCPSDTD